MKDTYLDNKIKNICNGCGVCSLVCPVNAIMMEKDSEGFLYPVIDETKCIKCNKCRKFCANNVTENKYDIKAYAAKNINKKDRLNSTSGGMFYLLAQYTIEKNGVVFGVKYDEDLKVTHDYSETLQGCREFSISKYVRSDLNNSYQKVKKFLLDDRHVLFTGTPCQVYGLKTYLNKEYEKLILCEIICHANPSPKIFDMYIKNREKENDKKIKKIYFRSKEQDMNFGPYLEFIDGTKKIDNLFNVSFTSQLINRPSCNNCQFVDVNRKSDFTIGDFWGIDKVFPEFNDKQGISLLTVNSQKASSIFNEIKQNIEYKESNLNIAFKDNHHSNIPVNKNRFEFFNKISTGEINEKNITKYLKKYTNKPLYRRILNKAKGLLSKIKK